MHADARRLKLILCLSAFICVYLQFQSPCPAGWLEGQWTLRRSIDVTWDAEHSDGDDLAYAEFYSAGKADPSGKDIRVVTDEGRPVATDVLMMGPGDRVRVAFALQKNVKHYYVYWGNPKPPESKLTLNYHRGLLLDMKLLPAGGIENWKMMKHAFDTANESVGRTMIERPFIGNNVLGDQQNTVSKLTGQIFAPIDGAYEFAMAADDRGDLLIDGQHVVRASGAPGDIRFNGKIDLKRGPHEFVIYHVNFGGDWKLSVGWMRPDMQKIDLINRDAFGFAFSGQPGPLEEMKKSLVADFSLEYKGESWYADRISFRYRLNAYAPKIEGAKYEWDFGDGQTANEQKVDHVYLNSGVYPVKLTIRIGPNSDSRTERIFVDRDFEHLTPPNTDSVITHSKVVAKYDLTSMEPRDLIRAVFMHNRSEHWDYMQAAAEQLASLKKQADPDNAYAAVYEAAESMLTRKGAAAVEDLWSRVPAESSLKTKAARMQARTLMWGLGDFAKATTVLRAANQKDSQNRRLLGMAMVLNGSVDDGAKILRDLPEQGDPDKRAAISGAMARTIEFYIDDKDSDSGDEQWDKWMTRYPDDFLLGYGVVLKARLIQTRGNSAAAAKLAEAFALAEPKSSYAPQLLDQASKLLAKTDAKHSQELKALLKQRYPEDPLSQ